MTSITEDTLHRLKIATCTTQPSSDRFLIGLLIRLKQPILETQGIIIPIIPMQRLCLVYLVDRLKIVKDLNIVHFHIIQCNTFSLFESYPIIIAYFLAIVIITELDAWTF